MFCTPILFAVCFSIIHIEAKIVLQHGQQACNHILPGPHQVCLDGQTCLKDDSCKTDSSPEAPQLAAASIPAGITITADPTGFNTVFTTDDCETSTTSSITESTTLANASSTTPDCSSAISHANNKHTPYDRSIPQCLGPPNSPNHTLCWSADPCLHKTRRAVSPYSSATTATASTTATAQSGTQTGAPTATVTVTWTEKSRADSLRPDKVAGGSIAIALTLCWGFLTAIGLAHVL